MGPAILLCPASSASQLWGQALPSSMKLKQKEGSPPIFQRCFASAGNMSARPAFLFYSAFPSDKGGRYLTWRRFAAASEVSVEEAVAVPGLEQNVSEDPSATSQSTPATEKTQSRRTLNRSNSNARKQVAVVSPAELIPGSQFSGKVVSIQSFGAFVDFGAFTNGLVHISRLSKSYVKKVEDVVQVGKDVKVQVLEVDFEANRISLMLVEEEKEEAVQEDSDKSGEPQPQRAAQQQARAPRRDAAKRASAQKKPASTTLKKNETVTGIVKNMIKSGVFLSLPDGTDGYLPVAEVVFKAPNTSLEAQFQVGEEVSVRVLRIERGRVNLSMRREVNFDKLNEDLNEGVIGMATNPFELAFRRNDVIASYLAERDKQKVVQAEVEDEATGASVEEEEREAATAASTLDELMEEETGVLAEANGKDDPTPAATGDEMEEEETLSSEGVEPTASPVVDEVKVDKTVTATEEETVSSKGVEPTASPVVDEVKVDETVAATE